MSFFKHLQINRLIVLVLVILVVFVSYGCASKRLTKNASKMEQAGIYDQAANYYYQAYVKKRTNIDALIGLKRTGQMVIDKKLSNFNKYYNEGKNKDAVDYFKDAENYYNKLKDIEVELNFPGYYRDYYNEVKDIYLEDKYFEAINLLQAEKFEEAEKLFKDIIDLQPNYKDAAEQLKIAIYEPVYRRALKDMELKRYRNAYYGFDKIVRKYGAYKESIDLRSECLEKAIINITIAPIVLKTYNSALSSSLETNIISEIKELNNPFLRVVSFDPATTNLKSTRSTNEEIQTPAIGKPQVADVVLSITVNLYDIQAGALSKTEQKGYIRKETRVKDSEGNIKVSTEYDKVVYYEYKMSRSVKIDYEYTLIDNRTGELYFADSKTLINSDNIHYAEFDGDSRNLVPGYWKYKRLSSSEDIIKDNRNDISALQNILNGRKVIKTVSSIENEIQNSVAIQISNSVDEFNPEK